MIEPLRPDDIKPFYPAVADIETAPDGSVLDIGFCYYDIFDKPIYQTFTTWEAFIREIIRLVRLHKNNERMRKKIMYIYAHNGANFDWLSLVEYAYKAEIAKDIQYVMSESAGIGVNITLHNKMTIHFRDSLRMLPGSLDSVTSMLSSVRKKSLPEEYKSRMDLYKERYKEEYYEYLKIDVLSLQESLYTFWNMICDIVGSIGYLPMTLPALAMRLFRILMGDDAIITTPWNKEVRGFTRRAYTGGRVECYRPGVYKEVGVYDVNSMYPAVMEKYAVPCSHRCGWTNTFYPDKCAFYEIEYNQTDRSVPPVLRDEKTGEFTYTGSGVYTAHEVALMSNYGTFTVKRGLVFQHSSNIFGEFVRKFYALRLKAQADGNEALSYICKIMLNSLYGKFGQKSVKGCIVIAERERLKELIQEGAKVTILGEGDFANVIQEADVPHEFVAIAAYITSYARITLYNHILSAGDDYVYSDTDSVHTTGTLETSTGLGGLKEEDRAEAVYIGKKIYAIKGKKDKIVAKGIGRRSRNALSFNDLVELLDESKRIICTFDAFPTVKEVLSGEASCRMKERIRTLRKIPQT